MAPKDEPAMLALLLALVAVLYAVTWLLAGPPGDEGTPAILPPAPAAEVTLSARQPAPDLPTYPH